MSIKGRTESGSRRTWAGKASFKRGAWGWRIIRRVKREGRIYELHATKGWRNYRADAPEGM